MLAARANTRLRLLASQLAPTAVQRSMASSAVAKVGDQLPDVTLYEGQPGYGAPKEVKLRELFAGKKGILFAVPGAFTPGCSKTHVPSYVADYDALRAKGVEVIVCTATNDAYVMEAWGRDQGASGKVLMLSDKDAALAKALGVANQSGALVRSGRYSAVVENNVLKSFNLADAGGGLACTLANVVYTQL
jgi:2-Cys peroxiredoxin 5